MKPLIIAINIFLNYDMIFITLKHISPSNSSSAAKSHSHYSDVTTCYWNSKLFKLYGGICCSALDLWWNTVKCITVIQLNNHHELQKLSKGKHNEVNSSKQCFKVMMYLLFTFVGIHVLT